MIAEVARVLREAADLIEPEGRWTTDAAARNAVGFIEPPSSPAAVCWCVVGAIYRSAGGDDTLRRYALRWLKDHLWIMDQLGVGLGNWNDRQESAEPVVAALRAAADEVEAS